MVFSVQGMRVMSDIIVLLLTRLIVDAKNHLSRTRTASSSSSSSSSSSAATAAAAGAVDEKHQSVTYLTVDDIEVSVVRVLHGELVKHALVESRRAQKFFVTGNVDLTLPYFQRGQITMDAGMNAECCMELYY